MKISGFSFAWNVMKLYYPFQEAIRSILPICHEFIIAIGEGDPDDITQQMVEEINDPKIKIINTTWDQRDKLKGQIHSQQTNVALNKCSGDWCFYVQADEVVHEMDLPIIEKRCQDLLNDDRVDGLIFDYLHFWGDYNHYQYGHSWYKKEIRIIKNHRDVQSWNTAQSFRFKDGSKIQVADAGARIFHYGWVRPPQYMQKKNITISTTHKGQEEADSIFKHAPTEFDYGPLNRMRKFTGTHPQVMHKRIQELDWQDKLRETDPPGLVREPQKDEKFKYRFLTAMENMLNIDLNHKNWRKVIKV